MENDSHLHREQCERLIHALVQSHAELTGALVSTVDGFEIAAVLPASFSAPKLAAMTSSLVALGESVSTEGGVGRCLNLVIESETGRLMMMDIPGDSRNLLTVISDNSATLGHALWAVRECAQQLSPLMSH